MKTKNIQTKSVNLPLFTVKAILAFTALQVVAPAIMKAVY